MRLALLLLLSLPTPALLAAPPPCLVQEQATMERAQALMQKQDWTGAAQLLAEITGREPKNARAWYLLGYALHAARDYERALEAHLRAAGFPQTSANASYNAACAFALTGKKEEAFTWLARAREAGFSNLDLVASDPDLKSLRDDPRFAAYLPAPAAPAKFLEDVDVLHTFEGEAAGDEFGWIGRNAGDTNGDGVNDVLISAPWKQVDGPQCGRIYVYSGKDGKLLFLASGEPGYQLGIGISEAGDVNRDGRADVIAGAAGADGTGKALVYSVLDGKTLLELEGEAPGDSFGRKVAGAGDLDGDGHPDLFVGAPGHDGVGPDSGRAYLFSGKDGRRLLVLDGEQPGDRFGSCLDGHVSGKTRLLIVGGQNAGEGDRGRVYVYRYARGKAELAFTIDSSEDDVHLGHMFVSAVGDVDADGVVDIYASDWSSNAGGKRGSGRVYVHSGKTGKRLHTLDGEHPGDGFGIGTAEAGDIDGDGHADLLIGAWQNDEGAQGAGKCTLFSGKDGAVLATFTCATAGDTFGFDTTGMGDLDGDGRPEFLITSAYSAIHGPKTGRAFVVRVFLPPADDR